MIFFLIYNVSHVQFIYFSAFTNLEIQPVEINKAGRPLYCTTFVGDILLKVPKRCDYLVKCMQLKHIADTPINSVSNLFQKYRMTKKKYIFHQLHCKNALDQFRNNHSRLIVICILFWIVI